MVRSSVFRLGGYGEKPEVELVLMPVDFDNDEEIMARLHKQIVEGKHTIKVEIND